MAEIKESVGKGFKATATVTRGRISMSYLQFVFGLFAALSFSSLVSSCIILSIYSLSVAFFVSIGFLICFGICACFSIFSVWGRNNIVKFFGHIAKWEETH